MKTKTQRKVKKTLEFLMGIRKPIELEKRQEDKDINCDNIYCKSYGDKPICYTPFYEECGKYG